MSLQGKTIVITGAASGIGAACAETVMSLGARVIAVDRNEPKAGLCDRFIQADLSQTASIDSIPGKILGGVDALCNIAGLPPTKGRTPVQQVNFIGLRRLTLQLLSKLNDGASIVNLASLAGSDWAGQTSQVRALLDVASLEEVDAFCEQNGIDDVRAYLLSKEALIAWTLKMCGRLRSREIRMNVVSPGAVDTPIHQDFMQAFGEPPVNEVQPVERVGRPDDIAPLVAFLCNDGSRWIRGANIPCDGGIAAHVLWQASGIA